MACRRHCPMQGVDQLVDVVADSKVGQHHEADVAAGVQTLGSLNEAHRALSKRCAPRLAGAVGRRRQSRRVSVERVLLVSWSKGWLAC